MNNEQHNPDSGRPPFAAPGMAVPEFPAEDQSLDAAFDLLQTRSDAFLKAIEEHQQRLELQQRALDQRSAEVDELARRFDSGSAGRPRDEEEAGLEVADHLPEAPAAECDQPDIEAPIEPVQPKVKPASDAEPVNAREPGAHQAESLDETPASPAEPPPCAEGGTAKTSLKPEPSEPDEPDIDSLDLDPETLNKLKILRRLSGPGKSNAELLAQIQAHADNDVAGNEPKKRWWKR